MIFPSIEDYILFIGGWIDHNGKTLTQYWPTPTLQLANYDVGFISSVSEQAHNGISMTDRQATLALKIIEKYERQLKKYNVLLPDHKHYRLGIREVNRTSSCYVNADGFIALRFPYDSTMIETVKAARKDAQGYVEWDHDAKEWQFAVTEYNVSWAYTFAKAHQMSVCPEVQEMFDLITECEKTPYEIKLFVKDNQCDITNAPDSMRDYLNSINAFDDIYKLVDNAGVLGYTVDDEITNQLAAIHGTKFMELCSKKEINVEPNDTLDKVFDWAKIVQRSPIVIYEATFTKTPKILETLTKYVSEDEIQFYRNMGDGESFVLDPKTKIVYTNKVLPEWEGRIPLLISYVNLMHGASKRGFLQKADKVVYHVAPIPRN